MLHVDRNFRQQRLSLFRAGTPNAQSGDASQTSAKKDLIQGPSAGCQSTAERHRHASVHREAQETKLGKA